MRERKTMEEGRGHRGHDAQVSSVVDRGERHGARHGERESNSKEWIVGSSEESDGETEEEGIPAGEREGSNDTLMALPWGTQESKSGGLWVDTQAGGSNERKPPSATADKAGTKGRHGARQGKGGHNGGRREPGGAEPKGVGENTRGHEASGVEPESHGVGGREGGLRGLRSGGKPQGGAPRSAYVECLI